MSNTTTVIAEPGKPDITITRWFDAPAHRVFEACTKPELVRRWWGPRDSTLTTCEIDFRVGGSWRFVIRNGAGQEAGFRGTYQEIVPNARVVDTFIFDPFPDAPATQTATLEEHGGRTKLTVHVVHSSVQARDMTIASGMEKGLRETHERLEELLAS